ncbi:hypothetical protein ACFOSD_04260 [Salinispirillum marinum]|uniref:Uncharacterized protein n=2 Tax=Saccharospirillaceae TaxID=255527 RepID=A0ABV8BDV4_9GAMM
MRVLTCGLFTLALCSGTQALDLNLTAGLDTNPMLSKKPGSQMPVSMLAVGAHWGLFRDLSPNTGWSAAVAVEGQGFQNTTSLSQLSVEIGITGHWQPTLGYRAPWYQASVQLTPVLVANDQRNTLDAALRASRHQRLTDRIAYEAGLSFQQAVAASSIFEHQRWGADGTAFYDFRAPRTPAFSSLFLSGTVLNGDFASARGYNPGGIGYGYKQVDDGLSDDLDGNWWVYRTQGLAYSVSGGIRYTLTAQYALDLFARHVALNSADGDYSAQQIGVSFAAALP